MPDVGTLYLTIDSDASKATGGLNDLAGALERIQKAVGTQLNLAGIAGPLNKLTKTVNDSKSLSNIGTFLNAVGSYKKAFKDLEEVSFNVAPIEALKTAIGDGIKIGQAGTQLNLLRTALGGDWNVDNAAKAGEALRLIGEGASSIDGSGLGTKAKNIEKFGIALSVAAQGSKELIDALGTKSASINVSIGDGMVAEGVNATAGYVDGIESTVNQARSAGGELAQNALEGVRETQRSHSPAEEFIIEGENAGEGYKIGVESKINDVAATAALFTKAMLEAASEDPSKMATAAAEYTKSSVAAVLSNLNIPEIQKQVVQEAANAAGAFTKGIVVSSKDDIAKVAKDAADFTQSVITSAYKHISESDAGQAGMQQANAAVQEVSSGFENVETNIQQAASANSQLLDSTKAITEQTKMTAEEIQEAIRLRQEENRLADQKRLENNYEQYRDLYLNGGDDWKQSVPAMYGFTPEALERGETYAEALKITMEEVNRYVDQFIESMNSPQGTLLSEALDFANQVKLSMKDAQESAVLLKNAPEVSSTMKTVDSAVQSMGNAFQGGSHKTTVLTDNLKNLDSELKQKKGDFETAGAGARSLMQRFSDLMFGTEGLNGSMKRMFPTLSGLLKRFKSMAIMRAMRYLIREISKGFSEGVQNVYQYSKAVGTDFAPKMDAAASSLAQFKNSIGAMAAPLIQAIVPALQTIINWVITGINYLNQLFALLSGQSTWTKALPVAAEAFSQTEKKAKGAGSAMKDLLADWDELNIIQSNSGGGGSGTGTDATDYASMFTEMSEFEPFLKDLVNGIKEEFGSIWNLVKKIAAVILGWKISNAFAGVLGTLGALLAALGIIDLEFHIITIFDKNFLKTGDEGWLIADVLTTILGGVLLHKVLGRVLGGQLATLAIPITLAVSAVASVNALLGDTNTTALTPEALELSALSAIKGGALAGYLVYEAGFTGGLGFGVGTAATLFWMGINIGLKAVSDVVDAREITSDTVAANFLSGGLVGAGLALAEVVVGGTAMTALTLAGGGAIVTIAALFAIEALIAGEPSRVKWGDFNATTDQIQAFVEEEVFSVAPKAEISLADTKIKELGEHKEQLRQDAEAVIGELKSVKLGLVDSAESDLKTKVETLVSSFNTTANDYQNTLKIAFELVPVKSNNGTDESEDILKNSESRWGELNGIMTQLGNELGAAFDVAYDKSLDASVRADAQKTIDKISRMMTEVADAISSGQAKAKAVHSINTQIANLSRASFEELIDIYKEEKDKLVEELAKAGSEAAEGLLAQQFAYEKLAEYALKEAGGDVTDETYRHYMQQAEQAENDYKKTINGLKERAEQEATEILGKSEGNQKIKEALLGNLTGKISDRDVEEVIASAGYDGEKFGESFVKNLESGNMEQAKADFNEFVEAMLMDFVGVENYHAYKGAIEEGILKWGDLIDQNYMSIIAEKLGLSENPEAKVAWDNFVESLTKKKITMPEVDALKLQQSLSNAEKATQQAVANIKSSLASLGGLSITIGVNTIAGSMVGAAQNLALRKFATGGFPDSGSLFMADENGNIEMKGRMGSQPVVANNQQIVAGISQGVATANGDVVSELRTLTNLMQKMLNKEFVARAVPSSGWGRNNAQSNEAYGRVTG